MKGKLKEQNFELMEKDLANWRGLAYYNRKDPRILVPKLNTGMGLGWTFNMANPYSYLILIAIILLIVLLAFGVI
jgi:uncharacterized membrane protein